MTNSPKKSVLVLIATGALLYLGSSAAQASPVATEDPATPHTHAVQAASTSLSSAASGQLGRSRILWCL
ncbi:hypothetical protein [Luteococcus sp.]|uniref:hypothetical protein n=1 Tax=Luteococcus sp. TaxID=1969402 RepID=UPI0037360661